MKKLLFVLALVSVTSNAAPIEVVNGNCVDTAIVRQNGEYFIVKTFGCRLTSGLEGQSSPDLNLGTRSALSFDDGSFCPTVLVLDSTYNPSEDCR
jgi:hypothetical protein